MPSATLRERRKAPLKLLSPKLLFICVFCGSFHDECVSPILILPLSKTPYTPDKIILFCQVFAKFLYIVLHYLTRKQT
jgi:hypothetical protein